MATDPPAHIIDIVAESNDLIEQIGGLDCNQSQHWPLEPCVIVFDTETTGFSNTSKVIELGYIIYSKSGTEVKRFSTLIKYNPPLVIKNSHIHKIKSRDLIERGRDLIDVLEYFLRDIKHCDTIVAHNIAFDLRMLRATAYDVCRELIEALDDIQVICTIKLSKTYLNRTKAIKLSELYNTIFDEDYEQTHSALDDTRMCARCYWHMNGGGAWA